MLDTSADYHTQRGIGDASRLDIERDSMYIITKVDPQEDAYAATRKSLAQLKLNYVDLVLIHRPPEDGAGEAAWQGLRRAKREGLVHDIGVSSYSIDSLKSWCIAPARCRPSTRSNGVPSGTARACSTSAATTTSSSRPGVR